MEQPLQLTFRGFDPTDALKQTLQSRVDKLGTYYHKIQSCRVVVETPHRHRHKGNPCHVRIRLTVPGEEIVVSRDSPHTQSDDMYSAIGEAFQEATRQLEDYVRRRRG